MSKLSFIVLVLLNYLPFEGQTIIFLNKVQLLCIQKVLTIRT